MFFHLPIACRANPGRVPSWSVALAAGLVGLVLIGCSTPSEPPVQPSKLPIAEQALRAGTTVRRLARLRFGSDPLVVEVPATARAGEPVEIHVTTYGGGCIREDTTVASVAGLDAEVVPYQLVYVTRPDEFCALVLRVTRRSVHLTFSTAGRARVRVIGRQAPGDSLIVVTRGLIVE
jgi:hypothetical protein